MGLRFPDDLGAWQRWQDSRHPARVLKARCAGRLRGPAAASVAPTTADDGPGGGGPGEPGRVQPHRRRRAVAPPGRWPLAVVASFDPGEFLPGDWSVTRVERFDAGRPTLPDARVVLSAAHYLAAGRPVRGRRAPRRPLRHRAARAADPVRAPAAGRAHLLAWSQADADFWRPDAATSR